MSSISESKVDVTVESKDVHAKKEWVAPQLKKISIEQLTAISANPVGSDGQASMS